MNNKGQNMNSMWGLMVIAAVIVVSGIFIAFGSQITSDIQSDLVTNTAGCNSTDVTACGADYNVTVESLDAQGTVAGKMNTMALVGVITIIIGLLMGVVFLVQRNFA